MPLTTMTITRACASALAADKNLQALSAEWFAKPFSVQIGEDFRRPPEMEEAPFMIVFADGVQTQPTTKTHSIGLLLGIEDEAWIERNGVQEMRGLARLDRLLPCIEKAIDFALPQCSVSESVVQFELVNFPLVLMQYDLTIIEKLPIGRR